MGNPNDNNSLRHFMEFEDFGISEYEICEPIGFDGATYFKGQEAGRHARNTEFFAIEKLRFVNDVYGVNRALKQQVNPQGEMSEYLDMGFSWIMEAIKQKGFNARINYWNKVGNVSSKKFELSFEEASLTDFKTYIECKLEQNGKTAEIYRKMDDKFNAFATENYKGEVITPAETFKVLRYGTAIERKTIWKNVGNFHADVGDRFNPSRVYYFNFSQSIKTSELKYDYVPFQNISQQRKDFKYFTAQKRTEKFTISHKVNFTYKIRHNGDGYGTITLYLRKGFTFDTAEQFILFNDQTDFGQDKDFLVNTDFTKYFEIINAGESIWLYWLINAQLDGTLDVDGTESIQTFSGRQISLPVVIPCVRYVDLIKQAIKSINDIALISNEFGFNGSLYEQVCYTKSMVSQRIDKLFSTPKECLESIWEVNADYEIGNDKVELLLDEDFYQDIEIGAFEILSSEEGASGFNAEHMINNFKIQYKNYANDRDIKDSSQSIHTKSEWNVINPKAKNKFERNFEFTRDSIYIQDLIDREIFDPSKTTDEDENIIIEAISDLPPNSYNIINYRLLAKKFENGDVSIFNNSESPDTSEVFINWKILGINIGQTIEVTANGSTYDYVVGEIDDLGKILKLNSNGSNQNIILGDNDFSIKYYYTGIQYVVSTSQDFEVLNGITDTFTNLKFTPKRIINKYFAKQLACYVRHSDALDIKNVFFKNNGTVETKLFSESVSLIENAPITKASLPEPYINPIIHNLSMVLDFAEVENMLTRYENGERGFIRGYDSYGRVVRGFIKDFKYNRFTQKGDVILKEKYSRNQIDLTTDTDQNIILNTVIVGEWKFENNYFIAYDKKMRPLCESTLFNLVILNGISYTDINLLITNLQSYN